jgi:hypothetical protein
MRQDNRDRRLTYEVAKELCKQNGLDVSKANPAYGYIRLETVIQSGQTNYSFPVLQNQTYNGYNQNPTERRLALQDNFVVGSKFFGMYLWNKLTGKPQSKLLTYIGPMTPPGGYSIGANTWAFNLLPTPLVSGLNNEFWYSGAMSYTFDYKTIIPRWDCLQHYYVPRTQAMVNRMTADPATTPAFPLLMDEAEGLSDGFVPMEPNIVISGAKNNEINYTLPFGMSFDDLGWIATNIVDGDVEVRLCVIYRGVLLQNTTNVK